MIDVNLTGVWHTAKAAFRTSARPAAVDRHHSSVAGLEGTGNVAHYVAAKHGIVG